MIFATKMFFMKLNQMNGVIYFIGAITNIFWICAATFYSQHFYFLIAAVPLLFIMYYGIKLYLLK